MRILYSDIDALRPDHLLASRRQNCIEISILPTRTPVRLTAAVAACIRDTSSCPDDRRLLVLTFAFRSEGWS
jgi:hypothetical protein